jgi:hypothetical protein
MKPTRAPLLLLGATLTFSMITTSPTLAQSTVTISMTAAPGAPRLQAPFVFGAHPASPLVFAIPATGAGPLTFAATGLPNGLSIAPATGVISGTTPAAGNYPISVTLTNAEGSTSATYTLNSGATLALTPPMGWNSYDSFGASVTEQDMIDQAEAVRAQLQPFGWNYVVIDYRWYEPGQPIDANGRYLPATSKYPSATGDSGFTSLSDRIHAMGLGFGIHIMRGVPRVAYDADLPILNSSFTTRDAGNPNDPCPWDTHMWGVRGDTEAGQAWYDALFAQYAAWGVDFIKIDDMLNNTTRAYHQAEADAIRRAIDKTGRSIVLSFSPGPDDPSWLGSSADNLTQNANMWRVVNDFWDYNALTDLPGVFAAANTWQDVTVLTPGHWADLDMLPLGFLGPRNEWHASGQTTFTENEQVAIMSLWSMLPSPLMYGGNPARLESDAWTLALLTNEEILAVNQDVLGARGQRTAVQGGEIWVRDLSGERKAVAFFNRGNGDAMMSLPLSELAVAAPVVIRDLWRRADVSDVTDTLSATVPGGAALVFTVSPPSMVGTGGAGGMGGMAGAGGAGAAGMAGGGGASGGGAAGAGGVAGSAGAATGGGGAATGGASAAGSGGVATGGGGTAGAAAGAAGTATGGAGAAGSGGIATGGGGAAGVGGASAGTTGETSGCGCSLPKRGGAPKTLALLLGVAAFGAQRRRRRRVT